jgi:hypothetical protein
VIETGYWIRATLFIGILALATYGIVLLEKSIAEIKKDNEVSINKDSQYLMVECRSITYDQKKFTSLLNEMENQGWIFVDSNVNTGYSIFRRKGISP